MAARRKVVQPVSDSNASELNSYNEPFEHCATLPRMGQSGSESDCFAANGGGQ